MKAPLNWLKDYVDITLPPADIAKKLTLAGFEVEEIQSIGSGWDNVFVGQILEINAHPNADRLRLVTVDLGTEQETVVCGAPNLNIGDKIAFARLSISLRSILHARSPVVSWCKKIRPLHVACFCLAHY